MLSAKQAATSAAELDESSTIDLDEHGSVYALLLEARAKRAAYAKIEAAAEGYLKSVMGENEVGTIDGQPVVSHKRTMRLVLSQRKLKAIYPITALMCMERKAVRTWRLLDTK
jgi:uncharacterized protein YuzE